MRDPLRQHSVGSDGASNSDVLFDVVNGVGIVTLNRPRKLNSLTHAMVLQISTRLSAWKTQPDIVAVLLRGSGEKGFCAGGDIKALYDSYVSGTADYQRFFIDEYRLDFAIHRYPKPVVALMDGIVMGGGMGLSQGAHLRLVTHRSKIAMPETGIGLVPDVGASWFLSKMPVEISLYLGMTGSTIGGADAVLCGLADAVVDVAVVDDVVPRLAEIQWQGDPLGDLKRAFIPTQALGTEAAPALLQNLPKIVRHFNAERSLADVMDRLQADGGSWEEQTLRTLRSRSPLMTEVTREMLRRGRRLDLAACFQMELNVACHAFTDGDFIEGVRALIIDKDSAPGWRVTDASSIASTTVDAFFSNLWGSQGNHPLGALGTEHLQSLPATTGSDADAEHPPRSSTFSLPLL
nr:enoyl-CoA hydratase/isomerase family protein [uncultured Cupriavidus sp.]